jgi:hypothetical protein
MIRHQLIHYKLQPQQLPILRHQLLRQKLELLQLTDSRQLQQQQRYPGSVNSVRNNDGAVDLLQVGGLVTMTIVDVFGMDSQGKLLSYCPTFDNRAIHITNPTGEAIRKSSSKLMAMVARAQQSKLAKLILQQAVSFAIPVKQKVDNGIHNYQHNNNASTNEKHSLHDPGELLNTSSW